MSTDVQDSERIIARLRPHARVLFLPSLVLIVTAGGVGYFYGRSSVPWQNIAVLVAAAVVVVVLWLLPLLSWLGKRYVITTRRIILRSGLFVRLRQELLHSRGYDITVRKSGLQVLFGSGDVLINTGLEHPVRLSDVPSADIVQSALHDLMEKSLNPIAARRQAEESRDPAAAAQAARDEAGRDETTAWGTR